MPVKKALFSKPSWAAKSANPVESDAPIFQQNIYEDILQERRRKAQRKAAKQKEREEHQRKSDSRGTKADDERTVKKRRISSNTPLEFNEDDEDDYDFDKEHSGSDSDSKQSTRSKLSRSGGNGAIDSKKDKHTLRGAAVKGGKLEEPGIDLAPKPEKRPVPIDEEDDELVVYDVVAKTKPLPAQTKPRPRPKPAPPPVSDSETDSEEDEYLKELKRKAREEARAKNVRATSTNKDLNIQPSPNDLRSPTPDNNTSAQLSPTVQILITTIIPNCEPIAITRRPEQTLESVHTYFCDHHRVSDALRPKVFFTWNNQRLFKSTTARSIIDQIKRKYGTDKSQGKIALEAVTDEIHELRLKQKERLLRAESEGLDPDNIPYGDHSAPQESSLNTTAVGAGAALDQDPNTAPTKPPGVVIKLTPSDASGLAPLSLRVHANTLIEKIVRGYKSKTKVDPNKEVYLVFDGDRLEGSTRVDEAGFEDGDTVDVRCK